MSERSAMRTRFISITVLDMDHAAVAKRAQTLGIRSVPAVIIDGQAVCHG